METHHSLKPNAEVDEQHSMDAVRDLLFGKKTREIGDQIAALEQRLARSMEDLERRVGSRFESLEQFVRSEIGSAGERFAQQKTEFERREAEASDKFRGLSETLDQRFSQLETHVGRVESETRSQILDRGKALSDEIEESSRRIKESIERELEALKDKSARRNEMGEMLVEMGMRMTVDDSEASEEEIEFESEGDNGGLPS